MLEKQAPPIFAVEGRTSSEELLVSDGQAVLVAGGCRLAVKTLRGSVPRSNSPGLSSTGTARIFLGGCIDQPKVAHFDMVANEEEIVRLDVQVLQSILKVHQIEGLGRFAAVAEQFIAVYAPVTRVLVFLEQVPEALIGQFHDDN